MGKFYQEVLMNGIKDMVFILKVVNDDFRFQFVNTGAMERLNLSNRIIGSSILDIEPKEKGNFYISSTAKLLKVKKLYLRRYLRRERKKVLC